MKRETIGFTTTIPVEVLFAAGVRPLDLNNAFINAEHPAGLVDEAEQRGFPQNICAWNKGIYASVHRLKIKRVIAVVQGDCSSSQALAELLAQEKIKIIPFVYPYGRDRGRLKEELKKLARYFGTNLKQAEQMKRVLDKTRNKINQIDELTWKANKVSGRENHLWTVSASDFNGDIKAFDRAASEFLIEARNRKPFKQALRLAYIGVPPIVPGLYDFLEANNARVVFNEVQRQFSMPARTRSLVDQYLKYTYPYDMAARLKDIRRGLARRRVNGVIHYMQNFCHRQIHDRILRNTLKTPILSLEFDRPASPAVSADRQAGGSGKLDGRTANRIQAFLEMIDADKDN